MSASENLLKQAWGQLWDFPRPQSPRFTQENQTLIKTVISERGLTERKRETETETETKRARQRGGEFDIQISQLSYQIWGSDCKMQYFRKGASTIYHKRLRFHRSEVPIRSSKSSAHVAVRQISVAPILGLVTRRIRYGTASYAGERQEPLQFDWTPVFGAHRDVHSEWPSVCSPNLPPFNSLALVFHIHASTCFLRLPGK